MEFTYYGANCILINTKKLKLLINPVTDGYGPNPKVKTDVILYTQEPEQDVVAKSDVTIANPGEYEIKTVNIEGIATRLHTEEDKNILNSVSYLITHNGIKVLVCGNIDSELNQDQVEQVDGIDVLVLPVGGHGLTLDKEGAASLVSQFDPNYVIPVHYDDGRTKYPVPQTKVNEFLQEIGASDTKSQDSFKVTSKDISEDIQAVVLKVQ